MNWPWLLVLAAALAAATPDEQQRYKPVPRLYGDRIPRRVLTTSDKKVQRKIVLYHNFFRSRVEPPAANMLVMKWHAGAEKAAQRWAEACYALTHDNATGLHTDDFGTCGQNIFISTAQVPWFFAIKTWFGEDRLFKYGGSGNELSKIGHYTQMVWASSHLVGCGWAECDGKRGPRGIPYFSYVCNYCPAGNREDLLSTPYAAGESCSECKEHCRLGKLCKNSCPWADLWANCRQLRNTWPSWLCDSDTEQGRERRQFCRATCRCEGRII
ncbi:cysteine-rich secretory protein 2-like [Phymastichus coffea]|uniref:cysteine-rich secretory protein 2-like n=1 Tax=Phymastichus coffea TaxID=108790 RepID=UPI00273CD4CB|nr:cysteine-rich secretory protein 2-like [Phymastichus coffea]XP_058804921.1 cysteine-rich secretory protein 2-like [Phymastichus coffea]XP_058804922.1 cysteine-rich secretory protein 2-like [Phymastichus coffea]XP_058804923.1 cysteine-rich secretory protein 2-like [Phymastichus coffea]